MKIDLPKDYGKNPHRPFIPPPIPLERGDVPQVTKENSITLKLKTNPLDDHSGTYELTVPYFRDGTPEQLLKLFENFNRIFEGQNLTTGPKRYAMARRILQDDALAAFNRKATELGNATIPNFQLCLRALATHVFPPRALQRQKRYMRRYLRKPKDMTIKQYLARYNELNATLTHFPPFAENQRLPDDEIIQHVATAIPDSWKKQMLLQNWDPIDHTLQEFAEFCERIELTEGATTKVNNTKTNKGQKATESDDRKSPDGSQLNASHGKRNASNNNKLSTSPTTTTARKNATSSQSRAPRGKPRMKNLASTNPTNVHVLTTTTMAMARSMLQTSSRPEGPGEHRLQYTIKTIALTTTPKRVFRRIKIINEL
jgi:hypothetical protein